MSISPPRTIERYETCEAYEISNTNTEQRVAMASFFAVFLLVLGCQPPQPPNEPVKSVRGPGLFVLAPNDASTSDAPSGISSGETGAMPHSNAAMSSTPNGVVSPASKEEHSFPNGTNTEGGLGSPDGNSLSGNTARFTSSDTAPSSSAHHKLYRGTDTPSDKELLAGDQAYSDGKWQQALEAYRKAARLAPKDPAAVVGIVRTQLAKANVPTGHAEAPKNQVLLQAVRQLENAIRLDSTYGPAQRELGQALLVLDRAEQALAPLEQAVKLMPTDAEAHSCLGVAQLATGKGELAASSLLRAAELEPQSAERLMNLATALLMRGAPSQASKVLERALVLQPSNPLIHTNLGTAYLMLHQPARALPHLQKAVDIDGKKATYRSNLGYGMQVAGNVQGAIVQYRQAISLDPNLGSAWINLGTALVHTGQLAQAKQAFEKAAKLDPTDPRPQVNLQELQQLEQSSNRLNKSKEQ